MVMLAEVLNCITSANITIQKQSISPLQPYNQDLP